MGTALFWIIWGIISFWALKTFYYSFTKKKLEGLRKSAFGINFAVLILTFLPWLPTTLGGKSGLALVLDGNFLAILFIVLLVTSISLFTTANAPFLKIGSIATIVNTLVLFTIMYSVRPGTFILTLYDIAPIVAVLFLLVGDVTVLLLWQQLQLQRKKK